MTTAVLRPSSRQFLDARPRYRLFTLITRTAHTRLLHSAMDAQQQTPAPAPALSVPFNGDAQSHLVAASMPTSGTASPITRNPSPSLSAPVGIVGADGASDAGGSTASVAASYLASPIPQNWRASLGAWWRSKPVADAAEAELHLYRRTGYFDGASVGNAPNLPLADAYAQLKKGAGSTFSKLKEASKTKIKATDLAERATCATAPNADGKVGSIRLVDLGPAPAATPASASSSHATEASTGSHRSWLGFSRGPARRVNMVEIGTPLPESDQSSALHKETGIDGASRAEKADEETKIVLLHGYGAGTAFFFQNLASLASIPRSRLYALDWLGMGRSARVPFHIPSAATKTVSDRVHAAENFFVDSLEQWRETMGVKKMVLVGHSLGGYLSLAYTLRHPERVSRLVLVSPVGIPHNPNERSDTFAPKSNVAEEINQPQEAVAPSSGAQEHQDAQTMASQADEAGSRSGQSMKPERASHDPPQPSRRMRSVFGWLWEQNFSPFGILRGSLFFGPLLTGRYTSRRFGALPEEELRALHAYCHAIFTARGSSEYCLAHLLAPGAYARLPMVDRISHLKLPISFIYGEHDWMDVKGGDQSVEKLADAGNQQGTCFVVPNSGHHVYLDNPTAFDKLAKKLILGQADTNGSGHGRIQIAD